MPKLRVPKRLKTAAPVNTTIQKKIQKAPVDSRSRANQKIFEKSMRMLSRKEAITSLFPKPNNVADGVRRTRRPTAAAAAASFPPQRPGGALSNFPPANQQQSQQQLDWSNLKPGTQAPTWVPDALQEIWAAGEMAGTLVTSIPQILEGGSKGEGFLYPGTSYIGPKNPLKGQTPTSQMDDLARIHDYQYGQLLEMGKNPYFTFNEADKYMLEHADLTTAEGWAIKLFIGSKEFLFPEDHTPVKPVSPMKSQSTTAAASAPSTTPSSTTLTQSTVTASSSDKAQMSSLLLSHIKEALNLSPSHLIQRPIRILTGEELKSSTPASVASASGEVESPPRMALNALLRPLKNKAQDTARRLFLSGALNGDREKVPGTLAASADGKSLLPSSSQRLLSALPFFSKRPPSSQAPPPPPGASAPPARLPASVMRPKGSKVSFSRNYQTQTFPSRIASSNRHNRPSFVRSFV